jgi:RNA polymerase sigma factor (sigma-70 family)
LLSEACVRAVEVQVSGVDVRKPRSFWATIIANLARDHLRTARNRRTALSSQAELEETGVPSPATAPDDLICARQALARVCAALEYVPKRQRAALLLRSIGDDYSYIAQSVGTSERNARKLVQMARSNLHSWE